MDNLDLVGLNIQNKLMDKFILRFDCIIRNKIIVGRYITNNEFICLDSSTIKTKQNKLLTN